MIAFCLKCSWCYAGATCTRFCSLEYLHYASICLFCLAVRCKCGPRTGIRTESAHKVVDAFGVIVPINLTSLLEYLGCSLQFNVLTLRLRRDIAIGRNNKVDSVLTYACAQFHKSVINVFHISVVRNGEFALHDDASGVYVMVEEEGSDTRLSLAVDDSPVDRSRSAVLWQQCGMYVERTESWHIPYHLGQHTERYHYLQVGIIRAQLLYKFRVFHLYRLQYGQSVLQSIFLNSRSAQHRSVASYGFVGLSHNRYNIISVLHKQLERTHSKLRSSHKYYA